MSTNNTIRQYLTSKDDIIKCRISRTGAVHVLTTKQRGDGGRNPWWMLYSTDVDAVEREAKEAAGYHYLTIPGTPSGTGNIYSLTSEMSRTIEFRPDDQYAVVSPAYFGRSWRSEDEDRAIELLQEHGDYHPVVIDRDGDEYVCDGMGCPLRRTGVNVLDGE